MVRIWPIVKHKIFISEESGEMQEFYGAGENVNYKLSELNLPKIESKYIGSPELFTSQFDVDELGMDYDEAIDEFYEQHNDFNNDIERWLRAFDEKYGTNYAPTGMLRMYSLKEAGKNKDSSTSLPTFPKGQDILVSRGTDNKITINNNDVNLFSEKLNKISLYLPAPEFLFYNGQNLAHRQAKSIKKSSVVGNPTISPNEKSSAASRRISARDDNNIITEEL